MVTIKNKTQLIENGETLLDQKARRLALESLERAVEAANPKELLKARLTLKGSTLKVEKHSFGLEKFRNIFVIGGGKASGTMAEALENILGKRITDGLVN
ncbi:DUF4147 domain-containing protein, partial [Candidatus Bathyarchaeota archaeon]|nr:DUF4147 domain-containing protein [Candidatus Bathyarchaeota archaeon]